jgi:hypothetical protein
MGDHQDEPIALADIIRYLVGVLEPPEARPDLRVGGATWSPTPR